MVIKKAVTLLLAVPTFARAEELKLPNLGESSTSLFSSEFEYQLGQAWLRMFRSRAPTIDDPLLFDYLEHLIYEYVHLRTITRKLIAKGVASNKSFEWLAEMRYETNTKFTFEIRLNNAQK